MDLVLSAIVRARELAAAREWAQARALLTRALRREPGHAGANGAMAFVQLREGRPEQAAFFAERAIAATAPGDELRVEAAKILSQAGERRRAVEVLVESCTRRPGDAVARLVLSAEYLMSRRPAAAARVAREGLGLTPDNAFLVNNLALGLSQAGRSAEAIAPLRRALARDPGNLTLLSNLALTLNYCSGVSPEDSLAAHRAFGAALDKQVTEAPPSPHPAIPDRRLTVGFLSPDLVGHSVARFIGPVCENLDPEAFRVVCFSTAAEATSDRSGRPRVATYRSVNTLDDDALFKAIRDEGADILIELSGHTLGHRLGVMRRRPAPVQATYLGYPNTTGVSAIGYRLVDSLTDPAPEADARATEHLVRIDPCFLCFRPPAHAPEPGPPPSAAAPGTPITFGSFNTLSKVTDFVVELWARVLRSVPGSRLLLKNGGLTETESRDDVLARFGAAGVEARRLELIGWNDTPTDHLGTYRRVDVGLDPFPYHGTTTTAEALWMGVPVVSLIGEVHAARVGLSVLSAVGRPEWATRTPDEYVRRAAELAGDSARLVAERAGLRDRMRASALTDGAAMGRRFGDAIRGIWREWCRAQVSG